MNNKLNQFLLIHIIENLSRNFAEFGGNVFVLLLADVDDFQVGELIILLIIIKENG